MATRLKKVPGVRNLYVDGNGIFYERSQKAGGNSFISLGTTRKEQAIKHMETRRNAIFRKQHEIPEEIAQKPSPQVGIILSSYREVGYPDAKQRPRDKGSAYYRAQEDYYTMLQKFFGQRFVNELRPALLHEYHTWRKAQIRRNQRGGDTGIKDCNEFLNGAAKEEGVKWRKGNRIVDLELTSLSNALTWAAGHDLIHDNPIKNRTRFCSSRDVRHCKELAPEDMNDLHTICIPLFSNRRSEALGWQAVFESLTGVRTEEALAMRLDAKPGQPGARSSDGGFLYVRRAKKSGFENPLVIIHDGLKEWLEAHKAWHDARYPKSPWYFPNLRREGSEPVTKTALTAAFRRFHATGILDRRFSSHGMRALYVRIRRSQGAPDSQIALELNQHGGVGTLIKCYGAVPPSWLDGKAPNLKWIPTVKRGWENIKPLSQPVSIACALTETAVHKTGSSSDTHR